MKSRQSFCALIAALAASLISTASADIGYQFVNVGNPGNANDTATGSLYGGVSDVYATGKYDVTLNVEAHKYYADGKGKETEAPLNEDVPTGVFLVEPGKKGFDKSKILAFEQRPLKTGKQVLHLVADRAPAFAGIDPYNEWIDRNSDDNLTSVTGG